MAISIYASASTAYADGPVNWTGFYAGITAGGGWADTRHTNNTNGINSGTTTISGGLLGGTYGYNKQLGAWVLGIEGDFSWSGIRRSFNDNNGSSFCTGSNSCETQLTWFGTNRARIGYTWDQLLVYGTAGIAYGNVRGNITNSPFVTGSSARTGFVYGVGSELAVTQSWSVKADFLRTDFGDKATYGIPGAFPNVENVSLKQFNIFRVGVNYRFN